MMWIIISKHPILGTNTVLDAKTHGEFIVRIDKPGNAVKRALSEIITHPGSQS